jgi:hypothetical protein
MVWRCTKFLFYSVTPPPSPLAQAVLQLATGCTVRGSNLGLRVPFRPNPESHSASYTMCAGCFPGLNQPGRGADTHSLLAPRVWTGKKCLSSCPVCLHREVMVWPSPPPPPCFDVPWFWVFKNGVLNTRPGAWQHKSQRFFFVGVRGTTNQGRWCRQQPQYHIY